MNIKINYNDLCGITWGYLGTTLSNSWRGRNCYKNIWQKKDKWTKVVDKRKYWLFKIFKTWVYKEKKCNNIPIMWCNGQLNKPWICFYSIGCKYINDGVCKYVNDGVMVLILYNKLKMMIMQLKSSVIKQISVKWPNVWRTRILNC